MSTRHDLFDENGTAMSPLVHKKPLAAGPMASERGEKSLPETLHALNGSEVADESGLRAGFLAHGGELLGFARRSLHSPEKAEDVVQETFARAWRSRSRFDPALGSLRTWLFTIERRVIVDVSTNETKNQTFPLDLGNEPGQEDHVEKAMLGWQMESALHRLDSEHRMVITELYFNGRSGREVAELLALPEGTVRSRAFYALRMLRLLLEEAGWNE